MNYELWNTNWRRAALWLFLLVTCHSSLITRLYAQNLTTFSASNIQSLAGVKLTSGNLYLQGTDGNNDPISFQCGGGGQVVRTPYSAVVTTGAITSFNVCNPANTTPAGIYYHVWVVDTTTASSTFGQTILNYGLVQWAGATFNFDNYSPAAGIVVPPSGGSVSGPLGVNGNLTVTGTCTGCGGGGGGGSFVQAIDVTAYGAKGDGITDDTASIDSAIAACNAKGGLLYFPPRPSATLSVSAVTKSGSNAVYAYTVTSGANPQIGMLVTISGATSSGNNGPFTISALGTGTFTVVNAAAVTESESACTGQTFGFYLISATPTAITNWACNTQGSGRASTIAAANGTSGIALFEVAVPGFDLAAAGPYVRDMSFNGNTSITATGSLPWAGPYGRNNNCAWLLDSLMTTWYNISLRNCAAGILMENSAFFEERNNFDVIRSENVGEVYWLKQDSGDPYSSFEHNNWGLTTFNTYASGDSVFKLSGKAEALWNQWGTVNGNFASSGTQSVFSLSGGSDVQFGEINAHPEADYGTAFLFYGDGTTAGSNNACGTTNNSVCLVGGNATTNTTNFLPCGGTNLAACSGVGGWAPYFQGTMDNIPPGSTFGKFLLWSDWSNLIQNGTPYTGTVGQAPPQWAVYGGGTIQLASVTDPNGNASQNAIEYTNDSQYHGAQTDGFMTIPGESYDVSGWYKSGGTGGWSVYWQDGSNASFNLGSATSWTHFETTFTAGTALNTGYGSYLIFGNYAVPTDTIYLWGISVRRKSNAAMLGSALFGGTGGGTAQAQTVALSPPIASTASGTIVTWLPANSNTGAGVTLAINGLTAYTVTKCGNVSLVAGDLAAGTAAQAMFDGTYFELLNPQSAPCGGAMGALTKFGASSGNTTSSTSWASLGLAMPTVPVNTKVRGRCVLVWQGSSTSYTISLGLNTSAAPTDLYLNGGETMYGPGVIPPVTTPVTTATTTIMGPAITPTATNTPYYLTMDFDLFTGATNPVTISVYGEVSNAGQTLTLEPQSACGWLP